MAYKEAVERYKINLAKACKTLIDKHWGDEFLEWLETDAEEEFSQTYTNVSDGTRLFKDFVEESFGLYCCGKQTVIAIRALLNVPLKNGVYLDELHAFVQSIISQQLDELHIFCCT